MILPGHIRPRVCYRRDCPFLLDFVTGHSNLIVNRRRIQLTELIRECSMIPTSTV